MGRSTAAALLAVALALGGTVAALGQASSIQRIPTRPLTDSIERPPTGGAAGARKRQQRRTEPQSGDILVGPNRSLAPGRQVCVRNEGGVRICRVR
jgi:hypothetical protein